MLNIQLAELNGFTRINLIPFPGFHDLNAYLQMVKQVYKTVSGNTFIGSNSGSDTEVNNAIAIGSHTKVNCSDCTVIGGKFVGINTNQPEATLEVNGSLAAKELFLITDKGKTDLVALIMQLKTEIDVLKQQMIATTKN